MKAVRLVYERWEPTVPNFITIFRLVLCLWGLHMFYWVVFLPPVVVMCCIVSAILDGVDGYFARLLKQESFSGKLLDPLVDKVCCWNMAFVLAHYAAFHTNWFTFAFMLLAIPPFALIGLYDYATMSMRATDEEMKTSDAAKHKQAILFSGLCLFLFAMSFEQATTWFADATAVWSMHATYSMFLFGGMLTLWQALRMTAESTRKYFALSKDPRATQWAQMPLVRFVLRTI